MSITMMETTEERLHSQIKEAKDRNRPPEDMAALYASLTQFHLHEAFSKTQAESLDTLVQYPATQAIDRLRVVGDERNDFMHSIRALGPHSANPFYHLTAIHHDAEAMINAAYGDESVSREKDEQVRRLQSAHSDMYKVLTQSAQKVLEKRITHIEAVQKEHAYSPAVQQELGKALAAAKQAAEQMALSAQAKRTLG